MRRAEVMAEHYQLRSLRTIRLRSVMSVGCGWSWGTSRLVNRTFEMLRRRWIAGDVGRAGKWRALNGAGSRPRITDDGNWLLDGELGRAVDRRWRWRIARGANAIGAHRRALKFVHRVAGAIGLFVSDPARGSIGQRGLRRIDRRRRGRRPRYFWRRRIRRGNGMWDRRSGHGFVGRRGFAAHAHSRHRNEAKRAGHHQR